MKLYRYDICPNSAFKQDKNHANSYVPTDWFLTLPRVFNCFEILHTAYRQQYGAKQKSMPESQQQKHPKSIHDLRKKTP